MKIIGGKAIEKALKELPIKAQASLIRSVNRNVGTKEIVKPLASILPYSSITTKNIKAQATAGNKLAISLGPTSDSYWLRFLERGTISRKGPNAGKVIMKAKPIIERFTDSKIRPLLDRYKTEMGELIAKFLKSKLRR